MKKKMTFSDVRKIKNTSARNKADMKLDKAKGIKEGSPRDIAMDKKNKVYEAQYGKGSEYKKGKK